MPSQPEADIPASLATRESLLEQRRDAVVALPQTYVDGQHISRHSHHRSQLLHALTGVAMVTTRLGRWMVPPEHALWIPAHTVHAVDILGNVQMYSIYVKPNALPDLPRHLHVAGLTPLMRSLIVAAEALKLEAANDGRARSIMNCLLHEIPRLPERPLSVVFPVDRKLSALCQRFLEAPTPHIHIDDWARAAGMSRRTLTRVFRRETGLSLSTWRQHACLMAALPRLAAGEPVTWVALDLGYDSAPAFTLMFKRMLGMSPRAYIRSARP